MAEMADEQMRLAEIPCLRVYNGLFIFEVNIMACLNDEDEGENRHTVKWRIEYLGSYWYIRLEEMTNVGHYGP